MKYRKCAKCGKTRSEDMTVSYHRFPNPGLANKDRASAWAKYCYPNEDWTSLEYLQALYRKNKVLCGRHFDSSKFYDNMRQKLVKFAVPDSEDVEKLLNYRENVFNQKNDAEATSDKINVTFGNDHIYNRKLPSPKSKPVLFNLRPKDDSATAPKTSSDKTIIVTSGGSWRSDQPQRPEVDDTCDEGSPNQPDEEPPVFSWQAPSKLCLEDEDGDKVPSIIKKQKKLTRNEDEDLLSSDIEDLNEIDDVEDVENSTKNSSTSEVKEDETEYKSQKHTGYSCDYCMGEIIGFRYKCVQCENYDLCRACESRLVHPQHYVLRIPRPTPFNEVKSIVEAIRERIKILTEGIEALTDSMVFDDIKEETPFEEVQIDPFEELEADMVPKPRTGKPAQVSRSSGDGEGGKSGRAKKTKALDILEDWEAENETSKQTQSIDLESYNSKLRSRKRKLNEASHDTQTIDSTMLDETYLEDDVGCTDNEEVEWLDESILESGDDEPTPNQDKTRTDVTEESNLKNDEKNKCEGKKLIEQVVEISLRKSTKNKADFEESILKQLLLSKQKKFNILTKNSAANRFSS